MNQWQLQEAKAQISELVKRAQDEPQGITVHGKSVAVVLSREAFDRMSGGSMSLVDFMQASPLAGHDEPRFEREQSSTRRTPRL
ncbi:type II toxin-antitoxin system Phd/YefM family antitoxin [Ramlibacter sp.]|uniref:type II toxin-antitoxin system Phd/YefM family antitoxin n=1 Tax=Ramlibacter sp. TaxID=1917967 RepID=UPI003D1369D9